MDDKILDAAFASCDLGIRQNFDGAQAELLAARRKSVMAALGQKANSPFHKAAANLLALYQQAGVIVNQVGIITPQQACDSDVLQILTHSPKFKPVMVSQTLLV